MSNKVSNKKPSTSEINPTSHVLTRRCRDRYRQSTVPPHTGNSDLRGDGFVANSQQLFDTLKFRQGLYTNSIQTWRNLSRIELKSVSLHNFNQVVGATHVLIVNTNNVFCVNNVLLSRRSTYFEKALGDGAGEFGDGKEIVVNVEVPRYPSIKFVHCVLGCH